MYPNSLLLLPEATKSTLSNSPFTYPISLPEVRLPSIIYFHRPFYVPVISPVGCRRPQKGSYAEFGSHPASGASLFIHDGIEETTAATGGL